MKKHSFSILTTLLKTNISFLTLFLLFKHFHLMIVPHYLIIVNINQSTLALTVTVIINVER